MRHSLEPRAAKAADGARAEGTVPEGARTDGYRKRMRFPRRSRRGIGIFGVLLGVAVTAFVVLGLVGVYQTSVTNQRTDSVLRTMLVMESTIRRAYANQPQFGANMLTGLVGAVPANTVSGTGAGRTIVTPWGGLIATGGGSTVGQLNSNGGTAHNNQFFISVIGIPESACESIASSFLGRPDVVSVYAKGAAGAFVAGDLETTVEDINGNCVAGNANQVAIVFRG